MLCVAILLFINTMCVFFEELNIMNAIKTVHVRIRQDIKEEASNVLNSIGLTVSDAVRLLLTKIAYEKAFLNT